MSLKSQSGRKSWIDVAEPNEEIYKKVCLGEEEEFSNFDERLPGGGGGGGGMW